MVREVVVSSEVSTPTAKSRPESRGKHGSKQKEVKDEYVPWLSWITCPSGTRGGYFNVQRNNKRHRFIIANTNEAK